MTGPAGRRRLVVNADDLGQSDEINRGIAEAVETGIVTSASLMVRWPAAEEAARWARERPGFGVGLHVDLAEWSCVDTEWTAVYEVVDADDDAAVAIELAWQLERFGELMGRPPTHLDSHQHAHRGGPLRSLLAAAGARLGVPVREMDPSITYCGAFYGQWGRGQPYPEGITFAALLVLLDALPHGTTELGCHPGADDLGGLDSMYGTERAVERAVLCDPRLPAAIRQRGIELCSFATADPRAGHV
ncbi:MAG: carbohydrate deacetylase [Acidimicrobiales bacterium]